MLLVMNKLCADILLNHKFLRLYEKVEISFGGERRTLLLWGLDPAKIQFPPLFAY